MTPLSSKGGTLTPYVQDPDLTLWNGDVREVLASLPDESVQMCVTSPPYWGLRDYGTGTWEGGSADCEHSVGGQVNQTVHVGRGHGEDFTSGQRPGVDASRCRKCGATRVDNQLGLEPTPEAFVAAMVEVFREVRRVLRKDGVLFLNLGDSYWSSPAKGGSGPNGKNEARWSYGRAARRDAQPNDTACTEPQDSPATGSSYRDLCGECAERLGYHIADSDRQRLESRLRDELKDRDTSRPDSEPEVSDDVPRDVQESTTPESSERPRVLCSRCETREALVSVFWPTLERDAPVSFHTTVYRGDTALRSPSSAGHNSDTGSSDSAQGYSTIAAGQLKPKDLILMPARVALALQADGWYLRSEITWCKPNPMPESVTDRPTQATEKVYLLTKSSRYFYDAEAVREPHATPLHAPGNKFDPAKVAGPMDRGGKSQWERDMTQTWGNPSGRNLRNWWEIATEPYPEAHFATYPTELVRRCIAAGSAEGDVVLDPFGGSGTTALVARKLGRCAILVELNADYCVLAAKRLSQLSLLAETA